MRCRGDCLIQKNRRIRHHAEVITVANSHDTYAVSNSIKVKYNMEEIELDIDTAIPIGLIVNELLTNALKYAFPDGKQGYITLSLEQKNKHNLQLIVEDDGIGKAKNAVIQGTGFGSQLIQLLTRQLNGSMREEVVNGTRFEFEFEFKPNLL